MKATIVIELTEDGRAIIATADRTGKTEQIETRAWEMALLAAMNWWERNGGSTKSHEA